MMPVWRLEGGSMNNEIRKLVEEIEKIERINPVKSYHDLEVFQVSYKAMIIVIKAIISCLPEAEKFDLKDQLSRSAKAIPRLIAEGYAKRHQARGFQKYLDDAMAEANETQVGLCQCLDLYGANMDLELVRWSSLIYDRIGRQIFKLRLNWSNFLPDVSR
jgi:four helix bundle protein